jgi:Flp pilus assembly protein CpaB
MIKNAAIGGGSNRLLLIFALVLGLLAAVLAGVYLSSLDNGGGSGSGSSATVPVVVAVRDIPAATTITEDMVAVKAIPSDLALVGALSQSSAALGQTTQVDIFAGEQIVSTRIAGTASATTQFGPTPPLSVIIPDGKRGFAILVSSVGASGGLIRAGDHVDVLKTNTSNLDPNAAQLPATYCYVLQNMQVLAVGQTVSKTTSDTDANGIAATQPDNNASTMTLAATPTETGILAAAQGNINGGNVGSQLWVALRKFSDHGVAGVPACETPAS